MKQKNKKRLFDDKRVVLVASLLLAVLAWIVVAGFINPGESKVIPNVAIDYSRGEQTYKERGLLIVSDLKDLYTDVRVAGEGSLIGGFTNTAVTVYPDYSQITAAGTYEVPLRGVKVTAGNYNVTEWSIKTSGYSLDKKPKNTVTITFEEVEQKTFTITAKADGVTAAEGYFRDIPAATPREVSVSGPKTNVELVAQVVAQVMVTEEREERKIYQGIELELLDKDGNELDADALSLTVTPDVADVDIPILMIQTIDLAANFIGFPDYFDTDWFYERVHLSTDTLRVVGSAASFNNLQNPYPVGNFDISQLGVGWESDPVTINLPEGMRNYDQLLQLTVSFDTTGLVEKTFNVPAENIQVINGPLNATITPEAGTTISVKLLGPEEQINSLLPENITIQVDAFNVSATTTGQQTIPARVLVPVANRVIVLDTYSVVCDVKVN